MKNETFINEGFDYAISSYLNNREHRESVAFNHFLVVCIRLLNIIYDELDIENPYYFKNKEMLYSNLEKYGYPKENIDSFMAMVDNFYKNENEEDFINIQKYLVDMFMYKKKSLNVKEEDINNFRNLLFSNKTDNPYRLSYNFMITNKYNEVIEYFDNKNEENVKKVEEKKKTTLNLEAYEILKYSLEDINNMSADELDTVNGKVYDYFDINPNAINKDYLLDKAIKSAKPAYSSGNGYVDILLVLGAVATLGLAALIFVIMLP